MDSIPHVTTCKLPVGGKYLAFLQLSSHGKHKATHGNPRKIAYYFELTYRMVRFHSLALFLGLNTQATAFLQSTLKQSVRIGTSQWRLEQSDVPMSHGHRVNYGNGTLPVFVGSCADIVSISDDMVTQEEFVGRSF